MDRIVGEKCIVYTGKDYLQEELSVFEKFDMDTIDHGEIIVTLKDEKEELQMVSEIIKNMERKNEESI